MRWLVWILGLLLLLSLGVNLFFLCGRGVHVTNLYEQHQNQQQAQLVLGSCAAQGELTWEVERPESVADFLERLSPEQSLFAKVQRNTVYFPRFVELEGSESTQKSTETKVVSEPQSNPKEEPIGGTRGGWQGWRAP